MSTLRTAAKILGLTSAAWLSGSIASFTLFVVPTIRTNTPTPPSPSTKITPTQSLYLWEKSYDIGKLTNPPISILSGLSFGYLAYALPKPLVTTSLLANPRNLLVFAAVASASMAPFTFAVLWKTNLELLGYAEKARKEGGELTGAEAERVKVLIERWSGLNAVRCVLPLLGAVAGGVALLA